ncbi:MAG: hypothetical protein O3C21_15045 [Verrucomicrobia bacterium]|nr:hypothetical protein [Verrucomicrobiota bacterium]
MILHFFPLEEISGRLEVFDSGLGTLKCPRYQSLPLGNQPGPPEIALHFDLIERDWLQGVVRSAFDRRLVSLLLSLDELGPGNY